MNNRREFLKKSLIFGAFSIFVPTIAHNIWRPTKASLNVELLKKVALGEVAAQEAFARCIGPVIRNLLSSTPLCYNTDWGDELSSDLIIPMDYANIPTNREERVIL